MLQIVKERRADCGRGAVEVGGQASRGIRRGSQPRQPVPFDAIFRGFLDPKIVYSLSRQLTWILVRILTSGRPKASGSEQPKVDPTETYSDEETVTSRPFFVGRIGMHARVVAAIVLGLFGALCNAKEGSPEVRDGDLIFQTSRSSQSLAIQRATGSPYSHMGLILFRDGKPYVFEAISTVQFTALDRWIARGTGGQFVVKRLRNASKTLTPATIEKLRRAARKFEGRAYDLAFDWSDGRIYCSELVWKSYDRALGIQIGSLQRVRDFNLSDPIVQAKMRERYGSEIPLNAPVISPVAMFKSELLVTVADR
jgi:hypothetical protein